jgi:hypothetical protein
MRGRGKVAVIKDAPLGATSRIVQRLLSEGFIVMVNCALDRELARTWVPKFSLRCPIHGNPTFHTAQLGAVVDR